MEIATLQSINKILPWIVIAFSCLVVIGGGFQKWISDKIERHYDIALHDKVEEGFEKTHKTQDIIIDKIDEYKFFQSDDLLKKAYGHLNAEDYIEALALAQQATMQKPDYAKNYLLLAVVYHELYDNLSKFRKEALVESLYKKARHNYEKCIRLSKDQDIEVVAVKKLSLLISSKAWQLKPKMALNVFAEAKKILRDLKLKYPDSDLKVFFESVESQKQKYIEVKRMFNGVDLKVK